MSIEALTVILAAIALGSFAKGAIGIGLPILAIPMASAYLGVEHAIVALTPAVFASNVWICWRYRKLATRVPHLPTALIAGAIGTFIGTFVLATLDDNALLWILVVWIALYLLNLAINRNFRLEGKMARRASPILAVFAGISQGATGISGPVVATWIHSYRLHSETYVFAVSIMFMVIAGVHLAAVSSLGLMDSERMLQGAWAIIPTIIFVQIGMWTTPYISPKWFNRLIITFVVAMEFKLIWQLTGGW
jgi:hypothetical protein